MASRSTSLRRDLGRTWPSSDVLYVLQHPNWATLVLETGPLVARWFADLYVIQKYEIGEPYEHMKSEFYVAEVLTPPPELTLDVYKLG